MIETIIVAVLVATLVATLIAGLLIVGEPIDHERKDR